jgi:hypothetical protein
MTIRTEAQVRRKERRAIPPFGDGTHPNRVSNLLDSVLAPCRFAPFPESGFVSDEPYYLNSVEVDLEVEPRFQIALDRVDEVVSALGAREDDLRLSLSARNRHLMRYEVLKEWDLSTIPAKAWSPDPAILRPLQSHRDVSFILALRIVADRPALRENGLDPGKVLCRKGFNVREPVISANFPFKWSKFGEETGYPEEMLWAIKWNDDRPDERPYDSPVDEVLTVWGNSKAMATLLKIEGVAGSRNLAWKMLAAEITTEIWWEVINTIEEPPSTSDYSTLAGQVFSRLSMESGSSYEEIHGLRDDEHGRLELRKLISTIVRVVD